MANINITIINGGNINAPIIFSNNGPLYVNMCIINAPMNPQQYQQYHQQPINSESMAQRPWHTTQIGGLPFAITDDMNAPMDPQQYQQYQQPNEEPFYDFNEPQQDYGLLGMPCE